MRMRAALGRSIFILVFSAAACHRDGGKASRGPPGDGGPAEKTSMGGMPGMEGMEMDGGMADRSEVIIAPEVQQRIGITTARVESGPMQMAIRTVGIVVADETKVAHIQLKTEGWVEKLYVTYTGQRVKQGDPLLSIYSPAFFNTQLDYLLARRNAGASGMNALVQSARDRLALWDVPPGEIQELERTGRARKNLMLRSLISGTVIEKKAFVGQHVAPEDQLYVIADLTNVWVQAKIYENELQHVTVGQPATITVDAIPNRRFTGKVAFVDPTVEEVTRTVRVRVVLPNQEGLFRPGMFGSVELEHKMGDALLVPMGAVIRTGERDIAYRIESGNRFVPIEVKIGPVQFGDKFQVLSGLNAGDTVVSSANFLVDSESRLGAGGGNMAGMAGMDMPGMDMSKGGMKGMKGMDGGAMKGMEGGNMGNMKMNGMEMDAGAMKDDMGGMKMDGQKK